MKYLHLLIWTLLIGLVPIGRTENALARSACDDWLQADTRIRLLQDIQARLKELEEKLKEKVDYLENNKDAAYEKELVELRGKFKQKEADVQAKEQELKAAESTANEYAPDGLEAQITQMKHEIQHLKKKLEIIEGRLNSVPEVSTKRKELERVRAEFKSLFGDRDPEEVTALLESNPRFDHPIFKKTEVAEIGLAIGRKDRFASPAIDPKAGAKLDELSKSQLVTRDIEERKRLLDLAKEFRGLPGELDYEETKALGAKQKAERAQLVADIDKANKKLAGLENKLRYGKAHHKELLEGVNQMQRELKVLKAERDKLEQELKQKKNNHPLKIAKANLAGAKSKLTSINNDLKQLQKDQPKREQQMGAMAERLGAVAEFARASGSRALKAAHKGNASACQESRNEALEALKEASALAAENRACLDPSILERVNNGLQKAEAIDCGVGPPQAGLIEVPLVTPGMTQPEASGLLNGAGLTKIFFSEYLAPTKPEDVGKVIGVSPPPGQMVSPDTLIIVSTYNNSWQEPEKAAEELSAAKSDGGAWDREADQARVSATTHTPAMPDTPTDSATPSDSSQVDRAREVAEEATAMGPQAEPVITPDAVRIALGPIAGIISPTDGGGGRPVGSTGITSGTPGMPEPVQQSDCAKLSGEFGQLMQKNQDIVRRLARTRGEKERQKLACQIVANSNKLYEKIDKAKKLGCQIRLTGPDLRKWTNLYKDVCDGKQRP